MAYTTEQEAWILCQIQKDRKQKQSDRAALRSADLLQCIHNNNKRMGEARSSTWISK